MGFNNEKYLNGQIDKQYRDPKESSVKKRLDFEAYDVDEALMNKVTASDIENLHKLVRDGEATYAEIVKCYWNQILKHQDANAVITLNPAIVKQAEGLTYADTHDAMYGIPVLVKDNVATKDLPTTAGAAVLLDYLPDDDAKIIQHLKNKGALILGKTNLSEWANFMSTDSSNGYSAIGGQTKNPYGEFDVGGSSSGSAVAIALGFSPATIGSETAGSIIYPASQNGAVGLKPTLGQVSQTGIVPISATHDTAGPIARTAKDAYALYKAITEETDTADWDTACLIDLNIGVLNNDAMKEVYRSDDARIMSQVTEELTGAGAKVSPIEIDEEAFDIDYVKVLKAEFNAGIQDYFESEGLTLAKVLDFNKKNEADYAPYNQELIRQSVEETYSAKEITEIIQSNRTIARRALDTAFESVDVLVTLSNYATVLTAASGYPAVTLPGHQRETGEPIGVTFIGKNKQDVQLLEWAYAYEQSLTKVK